MNAPEALGPWLKRYWGLEIVMSDSHTAQLSDAVSEALRELVRLRRREHEASSGITTAPLSPSFTEWQRAWWSAEAVLRASDSSENEATK